MFNDYVDAGSKQGGQSKGLWLILILVIIGAVSGLAVAEYQGFNVNWFISGNNFTINTLDATNLDKGTVTLSGEAINATPDSKVWFRYGEVNQSLIFKTENMTVSGSIQFNKTVKNPALYPNKKYEFRAVGVQTASNVSNQVQIGDIKSFTMVDRDKPPEKNFSKYEESIKYNNLTVSGLSTSIFSPFTERVGNLFWALLVGLPFIAMFITGTNMIIPSGIALSIGGIVFTYLPAEWKSIAYILIIVGLAGIIYSIFMGKKK